MESHLELALYRMGQELINNIVQHSGATAASLQLNRQGKELTLKAKDNGKGFAQHQAVGERLGLRTLQDRVTLLNGTLDIKTSPHAGAEVTVCIPVTRNVARPEVADTGRND